MCNECCVAKVYNGIDVCVCKGKVIYLRDSVAMIHVCV